MNTHGRQRISLDVAPVLRRVIVLCLALVLTALIVAPASAVAAPIMSDFSGYPDGYQFANFGGVGDWALFADTFGDDVHAWSIADLTFYEDTYLPTFGGGQCYGFAVTAGMFYRGVYGPDPGSFTPGATATWDIPRATGGSQQLDEAIERHISKYFYYQASPDIQAAREGGYRSERAGVLFDIVEEALADGWEDPWVLTLNGPGYGHAVNIIGMERTTDGAILKVYNNNVPDDGVDPPEIMDLVWTPDGFVWGTRDISYIGLSPTSVHERDHLDKWWGEYRPWDRFVLVSRVVSPKLYVLHIDEQGRRLGRTAAAVFDEIPDAEQVELLTGDVGRDWTAPLFYYLPMADYAIDLISPESGEMAYQMFMGDTLVDMSGEFAAPTTARLNALPSQKGFTLETNGALDGFRTQITRVVSSTEERAFELRTSMPAGSSLVITPTADASGFGISSTGAQEAACELKLTQASPAGHVSQTLTGLHLDGARRFVTQPWDWGRLTEMPIYILTEMPDGQTFLTAYNATPQNLSVLIDDMVEQGMIANQGIATSIRRQMALAPPRALRNHLAGLVRAGRVEPEAAALILATMEALPS